MVFNFECEHNDVLYDVDAETKQVGHDKLEVILIEVRAVNENDEDGQGFVMVDMKDVTGDLREALMSAANDELMQQAEPDAPRVFDDR